MNTRGHAANLDVRLRSGWTLEFPALLAIFLIVALRRVTSDDLSFYDEGLYLAQGLTANFPDFASFTWGPTYSDMYWLISRVSHDPVTIYFVGRIVAASSFVFGVWLAARLLTNRTLAWIVAAAAAAIPGTYIWPGVGGPAAGLLLIGLAVLFRWSSPAALGVSTGLIWIAAGSRPELVWFAIACTVVAVSWFLARLATWPSNWPSRMASGSLVALGAGALPLILVWLHGSPFAGTERSWVAFGQHFASRHVSAGQNPSTDYEAILATYFPGAGSVAEAFFSSPGVFATHVIQNIVEAPQHIRVDVFSLQFSPLLSATGPAFLMTATLLLAGVLSVLLDVHDARDRARSMVQLLRQRKFLAPFVVLLLSLVATALPVFVIFPRSHYLLVPAGLALIGTAVILHRIGSQRIQWLLPRLAMLVLFALLSAQTVSQLVYVISRPPAITVAARYLTESGNNWRLLGATGLATYVPNLTEVSDPGLPGEEFSDYINRNAINVVLLAADFDSASWTSINGFDAFRLHPTSLGFRQLAPGSPVWVR